MTDAWARSTAVIAVLLASALSSGTAGAQAERITNPVAVFAALDKVTARISELPVPLDETVRFGSLKITPRVCYSSPPTQTPKTTTFVEVDDVSLEGGETRIFTGWMFAESPGLHAVEHPVFDVWLTECRGGRPTAAAQPDPRREAETVREQRRPTQRRRRRVRR